VYRRVNSNDFCQHYQLREKEKGGGGESREIILSDIAHPHHPLLGKEKEGKGRRGEKRGGK